MVNYIPFVAVTLAIVFGYSYIVVLPKAASREETGQMITGGLALGLLLAVPPLLLCVFGGDILINVFGLGGLAGAGTYLKALSFAGIFLFMNTLFKYVLISTQGAERVIVADAIGNVINIAGNALAIKVLPSPDRQFVGLAISTLISQSIILLIYLRHFYPQMSNSWLEDGKAYWRRAHSLLWGEGWGMMLLVLIPIVITALTSHWTSLNLVSAYNVAYQLNYFLAIPAIALGISGAGWLAEGRVTSAELYKRRLRALWKAVVWTGILPALALIPFLPAIAKYGFQLSGSEDLLILYASLVSLIVVNFGVPFQCILRSAEIPKLIAHIELVSTFIIALPLFVFFLSTHREAPAFLSVILLPSMVKLIALSLTSTKFYLAK